MHPRSFRYRSLQQSFQRLIQLLVILSLGLANFQPQQVAQAKVDLTGEKKIEMTQIGQPDGWENGLVLFNRLLTHLQSIRIPDFVNLTRHETARVANFSALLQATVCQPDDNNDLVIPSGQECYLDSGVYQLNSVQVLGKLTLKGNTTTDQGVEISTTNITVEAGGQISADGQGYGSAQGPGAGAAGGGNNGASGGGYGGYGGSGQSGQAGGSPYGDVYAPIALGSGGGMSGSVAGGAGGGAIHLIVSGTLAVDGTLSANGLNGSTAYATPAGGGSGGSIWIEAATLIGAATGKIQANGGNGLMEHAGYSSGGSGGRIAINVTTNSFNGNGQVQSYGGGGLARGGAGTIYWAPEKRLVIDNNGNNGQAAGLVEGNYDTSTLSQIQLTRYGHLKVLGAASSLALENGMVGGDGTAVLENYGAVTTPTNFTVSGYIFSPQMAFPSITNLIVESNGTVRLYAGLGQPQGTFTFDNVSVGENSTLVLASWNDNDSDYSDDYGIVLTVNQDLSILSTGKITADGTGYRGGQGLGAGAAGGGSIGASGGGYGGYGGSGQSGQAGGSPYGDVYAPIALGSGGGMNGSVAGGAGGGAIHLIVSGTLAVDGTLSANGLNGSTAYAAPAGGGSGGSIWIEAATLIGATTGKIQANGGNGLPEHAGYSSGGSGGRIAIFTETQWNPGFTISTEGGTGFRSGDRGTIYTDSVDPVLSTITISPSSIPAGTSNPATITVLVIDKFGNGLANQSVDVSISTGGPAEINGQPSQVDEYVNLGVTDPTGTVTGSISSNNIGLREIKARTGQTILSQVAEINVIPGDVNKDVSSITVSSPSTPADGITPVNVTVTALDAFGNPVQGKTVHLTTSGGQVVVTDPAQPTGANGQATGSVVGSGLETVTISAQIDGITISQTASVRFRGVNLLVTQTAEAQTNQGLSSTHATAGYPITYSIHVENQGIIIAHGVQVIDTLPNGVTYEGVSEGCHVSEQSIVTCDLGDVLPGDGKEVTITAGIALGTEGEITNVVMVEGDVATQSLEENTADNTASLTTTVEQAMPALRIDPGNMVMEAQPGETPKTLKFTLTNDGLDSTKTINLSLSESLTDLATVPLSITPLASGESREVSITIQPGAAQAYGQYLGVLQANDGLNGKALAGVAVHVVHPRHLVTLEVMNDMGAMVPEAVLKLVRNESYTRVDPANQLTLYTPIIYRITNANGQIIFDPQAGVGLEEGTYNYELSARYHTTDRGTFIVDSSGAHPDIFTLVAQPGLYLDSWQGIMGVAAGKQTDQTLTARNNGTAPLNNLMVELQDGGTEAPVPDWVVLTLPSPLPDLQPGERISINLSAQPGEDVPTGTYPIKVRVSAAGGEAQQALINLVVSSSQTRNVRFILIDEENVDPDTLTPKAVTSGGRVILTRMKPDKLDSGGQEIEFLPQFSQQLDATGEALFTDLEIGEYYTYQVWAENYLYEEGMLGVQAPELTELELLSAPGSEQTQEVVLQADHFIYTWKVIEGTVGLGYKIEVTINNPDGSVVTNRPGWCKEELGCNWASDGTAILGSSSGGAWYSLPPEAPRPGYRLAKIQLSQTMVLDWQMFTGDLWLQNTSGVNLTDIKLSVVAKNEAGEEIDISQEFIVQAVGQEVGVSEVLVAGALAPNQSLSQSWQILHKGNLSAVTRYGIQARIEYKINGVTKIFTTVPEGIQVNPSPKLAVTYQIPVPGTECLEFDIVTTIENEGYGEARNLRFTSQQPQVEVLDGGRPVTATIISTQVDDQPVSNSLDLSLGNLSSGATAQIIWTIRVSEPVVVKNATGMMWLSDSQQQGVAAISSFDVVLVPGACKAQPVPRESTRDSGDKKGDTCPSNSYSDSQGILGDPINVQTGGVDYSALDLEIPTLAGNLSFKRWYSTQAIEGEIMPFGPGWTHTQDIRLTLPAQEPGIARVKLYSTNEYSFSVANGQFDPFPGLYASLKKEGDNYVLKDCVDWVYTFDSTGKVESVMDPQNHGWNYTYDGNGQLIEIRDNHLDVDKQRWIQLTYENGKLKSVRDDSTPARQVTYEYDGNGDLHYVTDVLGQKWEYTYDGTSHRLASVEVEVTTPSGTQKKFVERTEYDEQGRAWRQYNGNGELIVELNYETPGQTKARDGLGRETIYQFAPDRTLISVTDVLDSASEKTYDNNFRPAVLTDAYGNQIQNTWSADGAHLLNTVDALGGSITLQYEGNDLSSFEDALGHLTSYVYQDHLLRSVTDEQLKTSTFFEYTTQADYDLDRQPIGLLKKIIAPLNQVTEYHYDEFGRNDRVVQNGLVTTYAYDSLGRLINLTMPDGRTQATCYDLTGRVTRTVESSSPISSPCSEEFTPGEGDRVTENSYDAFGNLTAVVQPSGVVSRTYYDGANRPISTIQNWVGTDKIGGNPPQPEAGQPNQNVRTDLVYDVTGNLIASIQVLPGCLVERVTDANGDPLRDANGTQIVTVTPACIVSRTYYDALNRPEYTVANWVMPDLDVTSATLPFDDVTQSDDRRTTDENITTQTIFDRNGNAIATVQRLPGCYLERTETEGVVTLTPTDQCTVSRTYYDAIGRQVSQVQNWKGANLLDETPPAGSNADTNVRTDTVYDIAGNVIATIQVLPGCEVNRQVDDNGNPITDAHGTQITTVNTACVVSRAYYDEANRPAYQVDNWVMPGHAVTDDALPFGGTDGDLRTNQENIASQTVYDSTGRTIATIALLPGCAVSKTVVDRADGSRKYVYLADAACNVSRTYYDDQGRVKVTVQNLVGQSIDEELDEPPAYSPGFPDQNVPGNRPVYDETGRNIASIDSQGVVSRTYFDANQFPWKVTQNLRDPGNPTASVEQLLALAEPPDYLYVETDPDRDDWNVTGETYYDGLGRMIGSVDPLGRLTRTYYDELGRAYRVTRNLVDSQNPGASVAELLAISNPPLFDADHPDQNVTSETIYDPAGRAIAQVFAKEAGCTVTYQADGQVIASEACIVTRTYYDASGRPFAVVRNLKGQAISDPALPSNNDNNPDNDRTNVVNLVNETIYDASGQALASIEAGQNCEVTRGQSAQGLTGVTVGAACIVQRSYYDGLGRVETQVRNLVGDYSLATPPDRDLTPPYEHPDQNVRMDTVYDSRGNQTDIIDSQGIVTHFAYDGMDRLERVVENYRPGLIPTDQVNVTTLYTYDARGNRLSIESARAVLHPELQLGKTTFTYDALGRLLSERDPLNHGVEYTYNLLGQRAIQRDAAGLETQFVYDALGRVERIDYPGTGMDVSFRYYPTGQYRTMADGVGTTTWQYDGLERIEQVSDPFQQVVAYGYDGLGNRTRLIYPDARPVQYDYNALGQLVRVTDWDQQLTEYTFTVTGQLHTIHRPNAVTSTYTYNDAGWLTDIEHTSDATELATYHYAYDPSGNRIQAVEHSRQPVDGSTVPLAPTALTAEQRGYQAIALTWTDQAANEAGFRIERSTDGQHWQERAVLGADVSRFVDDGLARHTDYWYRLAAQNGQGSSSAVELATQTAFEAVSYDTAGGVVTPNLGAWVDQMINYTYDPLYRLTAADYDNGSYYHYEYDANGNRVSETTVVGMVESVYDAANRLTSVGGVSYTWDDNGNLLSDGVRTYVYDSANRLTSVGEGTNASTYTYNGLGERDSETVNGATTTFALDLNAGLTQVLQDGTNTYLYGNERIGQFSTSESAYFLGDALGSVRQLTDSGGSLTLTRAYEPYGETLNSLGSGSSAYGFTNEYTSHDLIYLRARWYLPYLNQFIQADTIVPDPYQPVDWNLYIYAWNNPIRFSDHTGKRPVECLPDEPGCSQDGRWSLAEHFLWVPGDIVLSSIGESGLLGYWSHAFGMIASWPKENGVNVIALPPWLGEEKVGWQNGVTESTLDTKYNDWVVLRVDVTQHQRDEAVSWASSQIGSPFISMYPRLVALVGSWFSLPLEREIEKYSWAGWLHSEEGFYCFEFPVEAYQQGAGFDITDRSFILEGNNFDGSLAMGFMLTPYLGDEIFRSSHVSIVSRKNR